MRRSVVQEKRRADVSEIQEILTRFWDQLIAQPNGPLAFRLILQPIMVTILAIIDGVKDADRPAALHVDPLDRSSPSGRLPPRRTEKSNQGYRLRTCHGRDLSVHCFTQVLSGRSASHCVRGCGSSLFVDSRPDRAQRATLEPTRCGLPQGTVKIEACRVSRSSRMSP